ncbi:MULTISPECIES: LuxR family transcriptional regulator [Pseudomonas]|uniref:LuxR family transcriptional regulator n=1 Tax=Pseudomonas monachiensis TaxID=3060212 RepID=A0ABW9HDU1_9PSED|nr:MULTISPECIES: LuxR family transcriptional regulator [unclassified Pseudomonas]KRA96297.1 protein LasR [Pseudomonas sp. Root68]KRB66884.1 protein LasR [Pseudomonas sp. Root71]
MHQSATPSVRSSPASLNLPPVESRQAKEIRLTSREKEVLQWSAAGKSSWEIGQIVSCSEAGVNYHFCNIRRKFGVRSRWIALVMALEQGLIQLP